MRLYTAVIASISIRIAVFLRINNRIYFVCVPAKILLIPNKRLINACVDMYFIITSISLLFIDDVIRHCQHLPSLPSLKRVYFKSTSLWCTITRILPITSLEIIPRNLFLHYRSNKIYLKYALPQISSKSHMSLSEAYTGMMINYFLQKNF